MNEKTSVAIGTLGTIILGVFAALLAWVAGKEALQGRSKEIVRQMLNFEINILIVGIIVGFIPIIGIIAGMIIAVINLVFAIRAYLAFNNNEDFKIKGIYEFVK